MADLPLSKMRAEAGNTGLRVHGGYVFEEYDPALRGIKGAKVFREMADSNSTIGAFLYVINQVVSKLSWHVQPKSQQPLALLASEYFESVMDDMEHTWADFVQEVLSMVIYGYAPVEIVLKERQGEKPDKRFSSKYDDGMVGIRKLAIRSQETILRWIMSDDQNDILGLVQMPWSGGIKEIPREKMLLFRTRHFRNSPEGREPPAKRISKLLLREAHRGDRGDRGRKRSRGFSRHDDPGRIDQLRRCAERPAGRPGRRVDVEELPGPRQEHQTQHAGGRGDALRPRRASTANRFSGRKLLASGGRRQFDTNVIVQRYMQQMASTIMGLTLCSWAPALWVPARRSPPPTRSRCFSRLSRAWSGSWSRPSTRSWCRSWAG